MHALKELHKKLVELSKQQLGYATDEVPGHSVEEVGRATNDLRRWGLLFVGKRGHRTARYFNDEARAKGWADAGIRVPTVRLVAQRAPWPKDAPMVITDRTKYTYGRAPIGRVLHNNTFGQF